MKEIEFYGECDVIGLAKRLEEVFLPLRSDPVMIPKTSSALKLLQRVRDEAHRFAVSFHRKKRTDRTLKTELTEIDGVGAKTANKLLNHFGSVKKIKVASKEELQAEAGEKTGQSIFEFFRDKDK